MSGIVSKPCRALRDLAWLHDGSRAVPDLRGPRGEGGGPGGRGSPAGRSRAGKGADPPWFVERSEGADHEGKREGVQGGGAARRSAAEPEKLRIPPGSWNAPKERTTRGTSGGQA